MNNYDEIKKLLNSSREMLGKKNELTESRNSLINMGLITEQPTSKEVTNYDMKDRRINITADIEDEIYDDEELPSKKDKKQAYKISGGVLVLHGKDKHDLDLTGDEKLAFQETMDEFVEEVSDLVDFNPLNVYPNNVEWSGKIIDFDIEFFFSIGEKNGVYLNGTMMKIDEDFAELTDKLKSYYGKFKSKWAKIVASRKRTESSDEQG
jgi:hypothetical protein